MGVVWLAVSATRVMDPVAVFTPEPVVRGIQVALGVLLAVQAVEMIAGSWLLGAGFAQIPLAAIIVTAAMIKSYSPQRDVGINQLSLSTGIMNPVSPFLGGMPMCHGGRLFACQYGLWFRLRHDFLHYGLGRLAKGR